MTRICCAILLLFALTSTASAEPPQERARFYNMTGSTVDGQILRPSHVLIQALGRVKFERLLRLKRSLLGDHLRRTVKFRVFK